jgi:ELWxxDGT repeat protein
MKKTCTLLTLALVSFVIGIAQVTQINVDKSLDVVTPLNSVKTLFVSGEDDRLWVSEGTLASTIQLNANIEYTRGGWKIGEKFVFSGKTAVTGEELYITDGSPGGTLLVKDIVPGATGSSPSDFVFMNGFVYFMAATETVGRELWRTNGTEAGTSFVKDINPGAAGSNTKGDYNPIENGNHFLFTAQGSSGGLELWKSDGTEAGTILLKDIEAGASSSNPSGYFLFNGIVLFTAKTTAHGREYWRSNGTADGTFMLKDINAGAGSSAEFEIFPGLSFPFQGGMYVHGGRAYFQAYDGANAGNIYGTDGSTANTTLLKTVIPLTLGPVPIIFLGNSISLPNKFFFSAGSENSGAALWQSDGTPAGTTVFKEFDMPEGNEIVFLLPDFSFTDFDYTQNLFQGNKFFFAAATEAAGIELWISDGTLAGTKMVKDINPGAGDGLSFPSYLHTSNALFFAAENAANGIELWKSDGTEGGTVLVKDIKPGGEDSEPTLLVINNSKVFFGADDGVSTDPDQTDLYVVDGEFFPLPARLGAFTVKAAGADALLNWQTLQEVNTSHFSIQRSSDGTHFENIGTLQAAGNSATQKQYTFTDVKIVFPPGGSLYYRLITNDKDGTKGYSPIVRLTGNKNRWSVHLSGNAPGGNLGLTFSGAQGSALIQVHDVSGRQVLNQKIGEVGSRVQVPVQNLPSGIYTVSVVYNNEIKTLRFVK